MILPPDFFSSFQSNPLFLSLLSSGISLLSSSSSSSLFIFILILTISFIIFKFKGSPFTKTLSTSFTKTLSTPIESFTIDLFNLPVNSLPTSSPKLHIYFAIVRFIKHKFKFCKNINFIADFNGKFNFLYNSSNVLLCPLITLNSSFSYNNDNSFNCSLTLTSPSLPALVSFIHKSSRFSKKN